MKTLRKVEIAPKYVTLIPEELEDAVLYISEKYMTAIHLCLCGCKGLTVTPLTKGGWTLIKESNGKVSLTPSIANNYFDCKSHYIITNNIANFV